MMRGLSHPDLGPGRTAAMTAITPPEAKALSQAGRLRGFQSGAREIDEAPVAVRGTLPEWLRGNLLLNGPALWELPQGGYRHWFDGLAMLHRVRIGRDGASYRSRFLQSEDWRASTAAGKPAMSGFGTDDPPGLWRRIRGIFAPQVTDNAAVVMSRIGGQWAATTETPRAIGFDPDTLATTGELQFEDKERPHLMSAHGINDREGNYWNVGVEFGPKCTYKLFRVRPGSLCREVVGRIQSKQSGYLHAFALTPWHALVWETALRAKPLSFMFSGNSYIGNFHWKPQDGSMVHAVSLHDGKVTSWSIPPMMCFHAVQAYEDEGGCVLELAIFDDATTLDELMLQPRRRGVPLQAKPKLARYRLRPGQARAEPEIFGEGLELPMVHPSCWTARCASVVWGAGEADGAPFLDRTLRLDLSSGAVTKWQRDGAVQLEPLFVAPPDSTDESEGVLLVPTLADGDAGTVVCVLEPTRMECLAELHLPQVVPFGFHAAWNAVD